LQRGEHNIMDELIFTNHRGYVFHDSCGFEAGGEEELNIVQEFVRRTSRQKRLKDRLHAIWFVPFGFTLANSQGLPSRYCIPMDNARPSLDLRHFKNICPDNNGMWNPNFMKWD